MLATQSRARTGAVVPEQAFAQCEFPELAVVFRGVAGDHLRRGDEAAVLAVQRVEHQVAVDASDIGGVQC